MSEVRSIIEVSPKERYGVAQYYVESLVRFSATIEADSQAEAEEIGYYYDNLQYDSVEEVDAELIDEEEDE
jgi:hypothetical protein